MWPIIKASNRSEKVGLRPAPIRVFFAYDGQPPLIGARLVRAAGATSKLVPRHSDFDRLSLGAVGLAVVTAGGFKESKPLRKGTSLTAS
jgi:hypothetical protein